MLTWGLLFNIEPMNCAFLLVVLVPDYVLPNFWSQALNRFSFSHVLKLNCSCLNILFLTSSTCFAKDSYYLLISILISCEIAEAERFLGWAKPGNEIFSSPTFQVDWYFFAAFALIRIPIVRCRWFLISYQNNLISLYHSFSLCYWSYNVAWSRLPGALRWCMFGSYWLFHDIPVHWAIYFSLIWILLPE